MRLLKCLKNDMYLELLCFFFFVLAFTLNNPLDTFNGFYKIFTSSSILLTDYVFVGGIGAAFLNVAINLLFNIILIKILKIEVSGPIFAGMMMIVGFSFFGKNIFNGLPIYLGVWLFSKMKKKPFQNYIITLLFSSGLSPIVSYSIFGFGLPYYFSIPLGIIVGIIVGILIPQFAAHTISFHQGYNLYNTGFALGIISCVFYGIFLLCGLNVEAVKEYDSTNYWVFYYILGVFILGCVIQANILDHNVWKKYYSLLKSSGRLITDYIKDYGKEVVWINYAINGIFLFSLLLIFQIPINGIIFGSIIAVLGCSGFGLHIKNYLPVFVGTVLAFVVRMAVRGSFYIDMNFDLSIIVAIIFATGLAPICGKYGIFYGVLVGFIHIAVIPLMINLQGGFDLYNNGLSCGFEAAIIQVMAENVFGKERRHAKRSKNL